MTFFATNFILPGYLTVGAETAQILELDVTISILKNCDLSLINTDLNAEDHYKYHNRFYANYLMKISKMSLKMKVAKTKVIVEDNHPEQCADRKC